MKHLWAVTALSPSSDRQKRGTDVKAGPQACVQPGSQESSSWRLALKCSETDDVAQWAECLPVIPKPWVLFPAPHTLGAVGRTLIPRYVVEVEGWEVQGYPRLHNEFGAACAT